mmetsp:Transcript_37447/g.87100  ORF Transcript_37447/g.87100 Transcript_37447/m.87100 type:complete len:557 (+) Transcript_37447:156-1826(+)
MGDKKESKILMEKAGVPVVPGYHGDDQSPDLLAAEADKIGYPVLIKATKGGGGKGMRVVKTREEFQSSLDAAKREAMSSFGDDTVILERFVLQPRHVEVQVFGDEHGQAVHLFERDCSVQRRHQKVLEESPAPGVTEEFRQSIGQAAVDAALAVGYVGAGTVEFVMGRDLDFYFMEMNTRLQVEHPVTEMVTGEDLVEWQLQVASGLPLPKRQDQLSIKGHALETRIYAEQPANNFLPGAGTVIRHEAPVGPCIRVDTGVRPGDNVGVFYDPMIAKLIVTGKDRTEALRRMDGALSDYLIAGLPTNINFLKSCVNHPAFVEGGVSTDFIEKNLDELFPSHTSGLTNELALSAIAYCLDEGRQERAMQTHTQDPYSPWSTETGFRTNLYNSRKLEFVDGDEVLDVVLHNNWDGSFTVEADGAALTAVAELRDNGNLVATIGGKSFHADYFCHNRSLHLWCGGVLHRHEVVIPDVDVDLAMGDSHGSIVAPMAGKVIQVLVAGGDEVEKGRAVVVMEAMKMEHTLTAPGAGVVSGVFAKVGDVVEDGKKIVTIEPKEE